MAKNSVTQVSNTIRSSHIHRRWQREFLQRMHQEPLSNWRCIGVDIGKYEHVVVAFDGHGALMGEPIRFGTQRCHYQDIFRKIDDWCASVKALPVIGMEPTGHYYEQFAYETANRYGQEQLFLIQSYDVSQRRKTWNKGTFKNDAVDASIIAQLLQEGHGRPYRPPKGVYQILYHLERYRWAREQAATRLKNQIIGHVDRLYPGLVIRNRELASRYKPMFRDLWKQKTPQRFIELFPDPYQLQKQTFMSLYESFRNAGYWMTRPYAKRIITATRSLCLPDPGLVEVRTGMLLRDLESLSFAEKQVTETEAEMARYLDQTWGKWLRPTGVREPLLASLVATIGDMKNYHYSRQIFGRSGLHSGCNDSGVKQRRGQGRRIVAPGDRHLRRQLLRFSYSMTPRYPVLLHYRAKLYSRGLSNVQAHVAISRRLTGVVYSVVTKQEPFDPGRFQ